MEMPRLPAMEEFRFSTTRRTRWSDEDNQHVLNHTVYLTLLEEARHDYCEQLGLLLGSNQFPFVILQANTRFLKPVRGGVELKIWTRTTRLGKSSFVQFARIVDPAGDTVCEGEAVLVAWCNKMRAKAELDSNFRSRVADFEQIPSGA